MFDAFFSSVLDISKKKVMIFFFEKFEVMETGVLSRNASFRLDQMQIMKEPKKHFLI